MKKEHLIPYTLLITFFIPWGIIGLGQYEIRIKELIIIFFAFLFFLEYFNGRKIYIDNLGKIYFYFIIICVIYTLIHINNLSKMQDIYFVIHVLIFTILNLGIYFIIFNSNLKNFNFKKFVNFFIIIYFIIFAYFIYYAIQLHILGQNHIGGFFTVEHNLIVKGKLHYYIGGANGRSWLFLILTSFLVGYFKNNKSYIKALIVIFMSILFSYVMLSRGALLFSGILLFLYLLSFLRLMNAKYLIVFLLFSFLSFISLFLFFKNAINNDSIIIDAIEKKGGFSNRDKLVFDSLKIISNDMFIGRGFHYTATHKEQILKEGYEALGKNNSQNTLLSISIELGFIGISLFLSFWVLLYLNISKLIKNSLSNIQQSFLTGVKLMIIFMFFASLFNHFIEKNFTAMPIYMIFIALAVKIKFNKIMQEN